MSQTTETPVPAPAPASDPPPSPEPRRHTYIPFFGCMIGVKYPQIEASVRHSLARLDVDLVDLDGFTCCPDPIYYKALDKLDWLTVAARNLCLAEEAGNDVVTMCSGCTSTLREANWLLQGDAGLRDRVNERLARVGREFRGSIAVRHIVAVLRDDVGIDRVRASVTRPLAGIGVAIHYGCHLLKPSEIMEVDDPDRPTILHELIDATGARAATHRMQLHCCGKACMSETMPGDMLLDLFDSVRESAVDCLGLACPTCFDQLELGQLKAARARGEKAAMPVLYYFQLLGLAQGLEPAQLGLQYHRVKADALLAALGNGA